MKITTDLKKSISLSTLASLVVILPATWLVLKPLIAVSLAEDIKATVHREIKPLNSAFVVLLQSNITSIRHRIATLEYRRDQPPEGDYTENDANELVTLKMELSSSVVALEALSNGVGE